MESRDQHLKDITEIRQLMERSTRFLSLSGFSGILVGIFALIGAAAAYLYLDRQWDVSGNNYNVDRNNIDYSYYLFFFADALMVLAASLTAAYYFSARNAQQDGSAMNNSVARRLIFHLIVPLFAGGIFSLILFYHGFINLIAPCMLIFYGLAMLNSSKYTYDDIRNLGLIEIGLGLVATMFLSYGLLFWAIGFGFIHIIYGIILYRKYQK